MKSIFLAAAACLFLAGPASAMTDAECATLWHQANAKGGTQLTGPESARYIAMLRIASKPLDADGTINQTIFNENCKADVFKIAAIDPGAPLTGANSFTEAQAEDRVVAAGMSLPSTMTKDANGIWRGVTIQNGKSRNVAVDYKGNVVAQ